MTKRTEHQTPAERAFATWMREVNTEIDAVCGLISDDLPDVGYWDMWDSGLTPFEAADFALHAADY